MDRRSGNKRKIDKNRWRGGYDEECKKIENDYIISLETVFNRLCINAKKGKINEKGTLKTYIEKIEQMNYQLEQFIKKVVYSF